MGKEQKTPREIVADVATILGVDKLRWSAAVKLCKEAMDDGFTADDFTQAAQGMAGTESQYKSIYSVFSKPDYWIEQSRKNEVKKGVW